MLDSRSPPYLERCRLDFSKVKKLEIRTPYGENITFAEFIKRTGFPCAPKTYKEFYKTTQGIIINNKKHLDSKIFKEDAQALINYFTQVSNIVKEHYL